LSREVKRHRNIKAKKGLVLRFPVPSASPASEGPIKYQEKKKKGKKRDKQVGATPIAIFPKFNIESIHRGGGEKEKRKKKKGGGGHNDRQPI